MSEPIFHKIDLPGKWRWKDTVGDGYLGYDRQVKLQKKYGPFWFTYQSYSYKSFESNNPLFGLQASIDKVFVKANQKHNRNKRVTVTPA